MNDRIMVAAAIALLLPSALALADVEGDYTYTVEDGRAIITDFSSDYTGDLIIPETLGGYPVTDIGVGAFIFHHGLSSVYVPPSVTNLGYGAFSHCYNLQSVSLPPTLTTIQGNAFYHCESLTGILLPDTLKRIATWAFGRCDSLLEVNIPLNVEVIEPNAFYACGSLAAITIPDSVKSIERYAFEGCSSLVTVSIGSSLSKIGALAFSRCVSLTDFVVSAANFSFSDLNGVLFDSSHQTLIQYPGGRSGEYQMPDEVKDVTIRAFNASPNLTAIHVGPANTAFTSIDGVLFSNPATQLIAFPEGHGETYTVPSGVHSIGKYAFADNGSIISIELPATLESIEDWAFGKCTALTSINVPPQVTKIGHSAFLSCRSLRTLSLPHSLTTVTEFSFAYCSNLESVVLGNAVTNISSAAFNGCTNLRDVFFTGNAPDDTSSASFDGLLNATAYYLPGTTGWDSISLGIPMLFWNPTLALSRESSGMVSCIVTGTPSIHFSLDASSDINANNWMRLTNGYLSVDGFEYVDSDSTNYPARFYRVVGQ